MRAIQGKQAKKAAGSGAGWIVTFADLMTLLLTFFVLLLSFSSLDTEKYKMIAQSMAASFGVGWIQGEATGGQLTLIESDTARPPTPEKEAPKEPEAAESKEESVIQDVEVGTPPPIIVDAGLEELAEELIQKLQQEIAEESLNVSFDSEKVIVRFSEEAAFPSGSEALKEGMPEIINKIVSALSKCEGDIEVSGYTDDRPISRGRFRSNWDLSAARAVSVVHQLVLERKIDADRVSAVGHAETNPLVSNDTPENRAKNRRVEIKIFNPTCDQGEFSF